MFDNKFGYNLDIVFNDGRKYKRKNMSKNQAVKEYNRYVRDMLILNIKSVGWAEEGKKYSGDFYENCRSQSFV